MEDDPSTDAGAGRRSIGFWGAVAIGVGGMVGGGIFAVLGVVAEDAQGGTPLAFVIAGAVALLTASSYAQLSVRYPSRGGSVVFIDRVFGVRLATGALNNLLWCGYLVTLSLYAVAFANYASALVGLDPRSGWFHLFVSVAIIAPTVINLIGAKFVSRSETAVVGAKLAMLVLVCAAGSASVRVRRLSVGDWPSLPKIAAAGMLVFVAYEGFELISNAAEDIRAPERNLPRALYTAVLSVIVIYVAVAAVTVGTLDPGQIVASADFALAEAAKPSLGEFGFVVVALSAILATFSAINATLYGTARLSYSIAVEGELPSTFEREVWSEPVGLLVTAGVSLAFANLVDLTAISSIASAIFLVVFGLVNAAAYRQAGPDPLRRLTAGAGCLSCFVAVVLLGIATARRAPVALGLLAAVSCFAVSVELLWLRRRREVRLGR